MKPIIDVGTLSETDQRLLWRLTHAPSVAWPTVILWALVTVTFIAVDCLAATDRITLWQGMPINTGIGYYGFSVVHDSIHRAVSKNHAINDWLGRLGVALIIPYVSLGLFRWAHVQHHRFTGEARDPDRWVKGPWWQLPFRWMLIDIAYLWQVAPHLDKVSRPHFRNSLKAATATVLVVAFLVYGGYGPEVLMLWFIPSRLIFMMLGFSFFWLPHLPHDTPAATHPTRATTIREGHEILMSLVLQYQNFHLIHHLYPLTPFYNNGHVWKLLEPQLRHHELAIQHGFAVRPKIHRPYPKAG
jgi:fatty acid desaturase